MGNICIINLLFPHAQYTTMKKRRQFEIKVKKAQA